MVGVIELATAALGFILPSAVELVKKKFLGLKEDTPEATLSTLATTKPEMLAPFVQAQCDLLDAMKRFFNRDLVGEVSLWVRNLRASIRPTFVVFTLVYWFASAIFGWSTDLYIKEIMIFSTANWFGSRPS